MPDTPRLTVILPSLNQDLYLEQAICSVLDQQRDDLQLIVMDGGSEDQSVEILQQYDDQIDHWQSTWDSGPAEALNAALTWATGRYVAVLDADDAYQPFAVAEALRVLDGQETPWVVGHATRVDELDEHLEDLPAQPPSQLSELLLHGRRPMPGSACFYRTDLLRAFGGFDSTLRLAYTHELHARLYAAGQRPATVPAPVAAVRDHELSLTSACGLSCGTEFVAVDRRYSRELAPAARHQLWRQCGESEAIYTGACEISSRDAEARFYWEQMLRRPWCLRQDAYRQRLLADLRRPAFAPQPRRKAA